jgi:hypothetical protein
MEGVGIEFMCRLAWEVRDDRSHVKALLRSSGLPTSAKSRICKSMTNPNVVVASTCTASTLLPRSILSSASLAQASASDFSRKQREAL